jgi:lipopolysaccharide transport system permease protein
VRDEALVIEAGRGQSGYWRDLWRYRELLYFFAWRDLLVRYKQTLVGLGWSLLRPLLAMAIFSLVFGRLARLPSEGVPYPVFVLAGLMAWQLFATALSDASNSLLANASLVTKVDFPRLLAPAGSVVVAVADALVSAALLLALMAWYGVTPPWRVVLLPAFAALGLAAALGAGCWLGALNVRYRDVRLAVPFLVQVGLYASPVGFASGLVPEAWRPYFYLNPMAGVIDGFRFCLFERSPLDTLGLATGATLILLLLVTGVLYFRRTERTFADVI